ncbi:MAG: DUF2203 domain-containing protein [Candidatus Wallbacteria bacterium]|nr:DUF2203 domain-containing protein [Candidatus Wallbacteria bacterium]
MSDLSAEMRLFTLDEANDLIPRLSGLMERVQRKFLDLKTELNDSRGVTLEEQLEGRRQDPVVLEMLTSLNELITEIEGLGCHFKGVDLGLVDFPALINGEVAYYCWQHGEAEIGFWHGLEDGFTGRHPIESCEHLSARHLN